MRRWIVLLWLCPSCATAPKTRYPMLSPCSPNGVDALCGRLKVPESAKGRTIELSIVVIPALSKPEPDPMVVLAGGGPGIASIDDLKGVASVWATVNPVRDIILFDQRGTGASNPIDCPLGSGAAAVQGFLGGDMPIERIRECRDALSKNADLAAYTTFASAEDLDRIRRWLRIERINLYGASYTSRLALVYAQLHPRNVRTVILKAPMPFSVRNPLMQARDAQRVVDRLSIDLQPVFDRLKSNPQQIQVNGETVTITPDIVAGLVRRMLMTAESQRSIPLVVASMKSGDFSAVKQAAGMAGAIDRFLNLGMFLSVTCAEDVAWYSESDAVSFARNTFSGPRVAQTLKAVCAEWPAARLDAAALTPKRVSVPALIVAGEVDAQTTRESMEEAARSFEDPLVVQIAGMAHQGSSRCLSTMIAAFVYTGSTKQVDPSCATAR